MLLPNPIIIDDKLFERLMELTQGEISLCFQCGTCTAVCPWGQVRQEPIYVRTLMRQAQLGVNNGKLDLWACTTCSQCEAYCPRGVNIVKVIRGLRNLKWEQRKIPMNLSSMLWSIYWNGNPWGQPPSQRSAWAKGLDISIFDPEQHDLLLYVGCTASYDRRAQKITRALVAILRSAGVKFGYLGDEEPCCGEAAFNIGHGQYFDEIAAHAQQVFQERGVHQVLTVSPHCYDVFKNHYPAMGGGDLLSPMHYTQYLAQLVAEGGLKFEHPVQARLTFQDPCFLGRHNGEYEAPRRVLSVIPGVELAEIEPSREEGLCCGGGGGHMWLETEAGERFSDLRVRQAMLTGANIFATACPMCVSCLEDSQKSLGLKGLAILDIAEIVALALKS